VAVTEIAQFWHHVVLGYF